MKLCTIFMFAVLVSVAYAASQACSGDFIVMYSPVNSSYLAYSSEQPFDISSMRYAPLSDCAFDLDDNLDLCSDYGFRSMQIGDNSICCGDDLFEYPVVYKIYDEYTHKIDTKPDLSCCVSESYCVRGGKCYAPGSDVIISGETYWCDNGVWTSSQHATTFKSKLYYLNSPKNCGDGFCDLAHGEDCYSCPDDCQGEGTCTALCKYCDNNVFGYGELRNSGEKCIADAQCVSHNCLGGVCV
ncbi:MAG TPA: hypothetical protein ENG01_01045 [Candidatus Aenigmarchaeota archaeon]|nr:MAG: hypothetical protein DRN75_00055 [Nanoarchaeota archaeon]HDO79930.1 hypothetical protein [Candidatus Aenigmarchaeota archaeon]HEX32982.1 hypothetical protein [Candidatus Aenigmarchaeota archaeon]